MTTTTQQARHEHYTDLRQQASRHMRYFNLAVPAAMGFFVIAGLNGPHDGWLWFLMVVLSMFVALWSLIEARYYDVRATICLLEAEVAPPGER